MIFTENKISKVGQVNKTDVNQILRNMAIFIIPLAVVYLMQFNVVLQTRGLNLSDAIPTQQTQGAIILYLLNTLADFLKKLTNI